MLLISWCCRDASAPGWKCYLSPGAAEMQAPQVGSVTYLLVLQRCKRPRLELLLISSMHLTVQTLCYRSVTNQMQPKGHLTARRPSSFGPCSPQAARQPAGHLCETVAAARRPLDSPQAICRRRSAARTPLHSPQAIFAK